MTDWLKSFTGVEVDSDSSSLISFPPLAAYVARDTGLVPE
jgi:hypothetical protein